MFQVEGILREILVCLGEPRQKILPNKDEFYLLGQAIDRIRKINEENDSLNELLEFIEVYLVNDLGNNIRNLIAHGYLPYYSFDIS